jgi:tetratricopeptide (TPR) repeat protein
MDSDGQLTFDDDDGTIRYKQGFQFVVRREFRKALEIFQSLKEKGYSADMTAIVGIVAFWAEAFDEISLIQEDEEKANRLLFFWDDFQRFYRSNGYQTPELLEQLRKVVFGHVRDIHIRRFQKLDIPDTSLLISLAKAYIELKDLDKAEETLTYALKLSPGDVPVIAHLSDLYFLKNDLKRSKAYLRQAFFLNAEEVPLEEMRSPLVKEIRLLTEQEGYRTHVKLWMPVCATYMNILDVKHALTQEEVGLIEEECRNLEETYDQDKSQRDRLRPILVFKYLYLIDHLLVTGSLSDPRILMYETRLKSLDDEIRKKYLDKLFQHGE